MKILKEEINWDEDTNELTLITQYKQADGIGVVMKPITPQEAAYIKAKKGY